MNKTSIEWTDYTSNLIKYRDPEGRTVHGCIKVSPGCANCYASAWSARGLTGERDGAFTAKRQATLTPYFDDAEAQRILRTRVTGKRVFVGDMTDVFGEWVPDALLDRMFAVFAMRPDLTFQLLTKRPERMRAYLTKGPIKRYWNGLLAEWRELEDMPRDSAIAIAAAVMSVSRDGWIQPVEPTPWPLPNVWLGVSVEDQAAADERIPELLATPAAVRFLSCEPILSSISSPRRRKHEVPEQRPHDEPEAVRGVRGLPPDGRRGEAVRLQHRDRDADRTPRPARQDGMEGAMNPKCSKCDVECEYMRRLWVHGQGQAACFCSLDCLSRWVEAQRLIAVVEER